MAKYFWGLVIAIVAIAFAMWGLNELTRSQADLVYQQARAESLIIQAQGQSRLDSATAAAITSSAMLPWLIVFCTSGVVTVAVVFLLRQPAQQTPAARIIERQIIYLPATEPDRIMLPINKRDNIHIG